MVIEYAKTLDELSGRIGLCERQLRNYLKRDAAPRKDRLGYNVSKVREFIKEEKANALGGDGSLRDEKIRREIEKLDVQIAMLRGELVNRTEAEKGYRAKLSRYRSIIEAWRQHESAKRPEVQEQIDGLANTLLDQMAADVSD